ncbi:class I SAM-dependent methyltransferase [Rhodobacteraceae bacterium RKSG542]|uniref:class I SAM-dependent methyltransferase n=1 Tax=Pseudovibrio flavus TaxID=2529854 RepID=UPI0012BBAC12|nr:class I SAM-dependent methyltransferase [Pseudovibrio flavus]MTI19025.1 class I SAM-dependent methyltransferase [Pseudovibrio flavus]
MESTPLLDKLRRYIETDGPMSLARYMELCLSDPQHGYYMTRPPFGQEGDFITAPEVSQLFGEIVGAWLVHTWVQQGCPAPFNLVEFGPGRGTLIKDILRVARLRADFMAAMNLHLVETSPRLEEIQRTALSGTNATWHKGFGSIPEGPIFLVANELFDALPIQHFQKAQDGRWLERSVGLNEDRELTLGLGIIELPPHALPPNADKVEAGSVLEIGAMGIALMGAIAKQIKTHGGAALIIDYGYTRTQIGETLQAIKSHQFCDFFRYPGGSDLSSHVNFEALAAAAKAAGAHTHGAITQADFLLRLGLLERAGQLGSGQSPDEQEAIRVAVERLAADNQMGNLFKVLAVTNTQDAPAAFTG